ncbi:MAG: HAMP domain-containing histidine kinase [Hyphomicrobiales bacterium]|nr:HAMP domain-containing histidine kinase [Hyphomicrobiales bacterium]
MAKRSDSTLPDVQDDRATLLEIARQIAADDPLHEPDASTGDAGDDGSGSTPALVAANGPETGGHDGRNEHRGDRAGTLVAARQFETDPAGLALVSGEEMTKANASFALAFGYASPTDLIAAGGLSAIFPDTEKSLYARLGENGASDTEGSPTPALTCSGRRVEVPLAVHDIGSDRGRTIHLLVLHPNSHASAPAAVLSRRGEDKYEQEEKPAPDPRNGSAGITAASAPPAFAEKRQESRRQAKKPEQPAAGVTDPDLLAKISHEIRTPLNSIMGFAELMHEERLGPIENERYKNYIRDIRESGGYALSLVNDLLDISTIEADRYELNFTAVDINETIRECVGMMQSQAQENRVFLRMSLSDETPVVVADIHSVKQILLNLLSNAIRFTGGGGQVIICSRRKPSGAASILVRDNGAAMTPEEIELAMEPFRQLDTAPRRQVGTGLGLPLTRALVKANHATFKLKSHAKLGTRIEIIFPADRLAPS